MPGIRLSVGREPEVLRIVGFGVNFGLQLTPRPVRVNTLLSFAAPCHPSQTSAGAPSLPRTSRPSFGGRSTLTHYHLNT